MASEVPTIDLNDGNKIPIIGLGTWKSESDEVSQAVKDAIDIGYRHIDTAFIYFNEKQVGEAIHQKIDQGIISREDIFVTSKLWNTYHRPDLVEQCCQISLNDLQLDYIDLYLMHNPIALKEEGSPLPEDESGKVVESDVDLVDTWKAMEQLVEKGLVKSIGVSNFNMKQLERLVENASIVPAMVQVECHPYLNQNKLFDFCKQKIIAVTAYSPFGSPDSPWTKPNDPKILEDPVLINIGKTYEKSAAQVILRWLVQRGVIVIPKSVNKNRIAENFNIFYFDLTDNEMEMINNLNRNWRAITFPGFSNCKDYPFRNEVRAPMLKLNSGHEIPIIGLGTWKSKPGEVKQAVMDAIDIGYRHIDEAYFYLNETEAGEGIRQKIEEGLISREDIFITSKLWNTFHHPDHVESAMQKSLDALGLDYIDLYLMHWPMAWQGQNDGQPSMAKIVESDVDFVETWKAMEQLVDKGMVKSIGVSNFNVKQIERLLASASIAPAMLQVECHPYLNQQELVEFCKCKNIAVTAYSPFGSPDSPWASPNDPKLLEDPTLVEIGSKYGKSAGQVILRWMTQRGVIVIPKSVNENRIAENYNIFDFWLTDSDMEVINALDRNWRFIKVLEFKDQKEYPFEKDHDSCLQGSKEFVGYLFLLVAAGAGKV